MKRYRNRGRERDRGREHWPWKKNWILIWNIPLVSVLDAFLYPIHIWYSYVAFLDFLCFIACYSHLLVFLCYLLLQLCIIIDLFLHLFLGALQCSLNIDPIWWDLRLVLVWFGLWIVVFRNMSSYMFHF